MKYWPVFNDYIREIPCEPAGKALAASQVGRATKIPNANRCSSSSRTVFDGDCQSYRFDD